MIMVATFTFLLLLLAAPWGPQGLISLTRDWTWATAMKAQNLNHYANQEFPLS